MNTELKIGDKAHGGIIAYIDDTGEHGLVCSLEDLGEFNFEEAKKVCKDYESKYKPLSPITRNFGTVSSEKDWYLPSKFELNLLWENLYRKGFGSFANRYYWSLTEDDNFFAWAQGFGDDFQDYHYANNSKCNEYIVRAVRAF